MNDISLSVDLFTDWKSGYFIVSLELVTRCIQLEGNIKTRKDVIVCWMYKYLLHLNMHLLIKISDILHVDLKQWIWCYLVAYMYLDIKKMK